MGVVQAAVGSSQVAEDVPRWRDWSIHDVSPSVTGLVWFQSLPLHLTTVFGLVDSPNIIWVNTLYTFAHASVRTPLAIPSKILSMQIHSPQIK